jgi:hypothetical protein
VEPAEAGVEPAEAAVEPAEAGVEQVAAAADDNNPVSSNQMKKTHSISCGFFKTLYFPF